LSTQKAACFEGLLDGEAFCEVFWFAFHGDGLADAQCAAVHVFSKCGTIDAELRSGFPQCFGGLPGKCTPGQERVESGKHGVVGVREARLGAGSEPGAVLSVLAFELTVVGGAVRRTVEYEHAVSLEHGQDSRGCMLFGSVEAEHERLAILLQVRFEESADRLGVVATDAFESGPIRDGAIRSDKPVDTRANLHRVEAAHDTGLRYDDMLRVLFALTFESRTHLLFDFACLAPRQARHPVSEAFGSDQSMEIAHELRSLLSRRGVGL
jgi:hypothetical protein